jgi:hypothetical protein
MKPEAKVGCPNARENPTSAHVNDDMLKIRKLNEMMLSKFFLLARPP